MLLKELPAHLDPSGESRCQPDYAVRLAAQRDAPERSHGK
jgi:hypothetical protein